jgi:hypothetical protein
MKYSMSIAEASRVLGKTPRTIRNYINSGQLSSGQHGRSRYLNPEEVHELLVDDQSTRVTAAEFRAIRAQVRRLESEMMVIQHMLDLRNETLGMTEEFSRELYAAAIEQYQRPVGSYSLKELESWADVFARMDENDLSTIGAAVQRDAWKVLLRLSARLLTDVVSREDYKTSLALQQAHKLLADARRRLRISIFIYIEMSNELPVDLRIETPMKDDLFESLKNAIKSS